MSSFNYHEEPPKASQIPLSEINTILKADYIAGMCRALFGPESAAITVQGTGDAGDGPFNLSQPNYLARLAFLRLEDAHTNGGDRPFKVAVAITGHQVDVKRAISMPEDEIKKLAYVWPDGVKTSLLDLNLQDIHHESICFQPGLGEEGEFDVTGSSIGFKPTSKPSNSFVHSAYGITTNFRDSGGLSEAGLLANLTTYEVTVDVLSRGEHDPEAVDTLDEATLHNNCIRILPEDSTAAERVRPHLHALFKKAVETPKLRDMIAWQQYWKERSA